MDSWWVGKPFGNGSSWVSVRGNIHNYNEGVALAYAVSTSLWNREVGGKRAGNFIRGTNYQGIDNYEIRDSVMIGGNDWYGNRVGGRKQI